MEFLKGRSGQSSVEWLVVAAIIIAVVGGVLLGLLGKLRDKFQAVNNAL